MRSAPLLLLLFAALARVGDSLVPSHIITFSAVRFKHTLRNLPSFPLYASGSTRDDDGGDKIINVYADTRDVDAVITEVMKLVNRKANLNHNNGDTSGVITKTALVESEEQIGNSLNAIESSFKTIFSNLKVTESLSNNDKNTLFTELNLSLIHI